MTITFQVKFTRPAGNYWPDSFEGNVIVPDGDHAGSVVSALLSHLTSGLPRVVRKVEVRNWEALCQGACPCCGAPDPVLRGMTLDMVVTYCHNCTGLASTPIGWQGDISGAESIENAETVGGGDP